MSKNDVKLLGADLAVGESTEFVRCPFCMAEHEQKFSVTRTETGLLYNCFRASCPAGGFVGTGYWEAAPPAGIIKPKRRPYLRPLYPITAKDEVFFRKTWDLNPRGFMHTDRDEYALPILAPHGFRKGWVIRQPVWKGRKCWRSGVPGKPKALTYKDDPEQSKLSWSRRLTTENSPDHIVVVEDILSAWKVSQSCSARAVALNGADMGYTEVAEIAQTSPAAVTIWLDPDATSQAYRLLGKWGLSFNYCSVLISEADPKDIPKDEIRRRIADAGW